MKCWKCLKRFFAKFKKKELVTIEDAYKELKSYSKNQLVRELIVQAQINNENDYGVEAEFKKQIKTYPKKKLMKAIILLRVQNDSKFKKVIKKEMQDD